MVQFAGGITLPDAGQQVGCQDGDDQEQSYDDHQQLAGNVIQAEAIFQEADDENGDQSSAQVSFAAAGTDATENHHGNNIEFIHVTNIGLVDDIRTSEDGVSPDMKPANVRGENPDLVDLDAEKMLAVRLLPMA
jgi:hypothetical protein